MARPGISDIRASQDHAVLFRWNVLFASFPSGLAAAPDLNAVNVRCESTEQPSRTGQTIVTNIRGHQVKQSGIWTYNPITLTFVDTTDNLIPNFLHDWVELTWQTNTGTAVPKSEQEATVILQRLNNNDDPIVEFKLVGAIPEAEDKGGTLDGSSSDVLRPTVTLNYDLYRYTSLI